MSKYGHKPHNWFEAIVNKMGGERSGDAFLRDELTISKSALPWYGEEPMVIRFTVISDGTTGTDWITRLKWKGYKTDLGSKGILLSEDFNPTNGVVYEVAVLNAKLWTEDNRVSRKIRYEATQIRKLFASHPEIACLIREKFTDEELEMMGLQWIAVFHDSIRDSEGKRRVLSLGCYNDQSWLSADYADPDQVFSFDYGFAFVVSETNIRN